MSNQLQAVNGYGTPQTPDVPCVGCDYVEDCRQGMACYNYALSVSATGRLGRSVFRQYPTIPAREVYLHCFGGGHDD